MYCVYDECVKVCTCNTHTHNPCTLLSHTHNHTYTHTLVGRERTTSKNADEQAWEPISDFEGRYYEDLVNNPGETPEEFLAKEGGGELPDGLMPATVANARRTRVQGWASPQMLKVEIEKYGAAGCDYVYDDDAKRGEWSCPPTDELPAYKQAPVSNTYFAARGRAASPLRMAQMAQMRQMRQRALRVELVPQ